MNTELRWLMHGSPSRSPQHRGQVLLYPSLPGVKCDVCWVTSAHTIPLPAELPPNSAAWDLIPDSQTPVSWDRFNRLANIIRLNLPVHAQVNRIQPGNMLATGVWQRKRKKYDDVVWTRPTLCHSTVKEVFENLNLTGAYFGRVVEISFQESFSQNLVVNPSQYSQWHTLVVPGNPAKKIRIDEYEGRECTQCGRIALTEDQELRFTDDCERLSTLRTIPSRWCIDADIFVSMVFPTGYVVSERLKNALTERNTSGVLWHKLKISD